MEYSGLKHFLTTRTGDPVPPVAGLQLGGIRMEWPLYKSLALTKTAEKSPPLLLDSHPIRTPPSRGLAAVEEQEIGGGGVSSYGDQWDPHLSSIYHPSRG